MRRFAMYAATLAMVPALAGCGGDPEPQFTPSQSPSATASASPSADPTPKALSREATVRAWVEARNAALASGDTRR